MPTLSSMTKEQLTAKLSRLKAIYQDYKSKNLSLDMSRGKPCTEQLELTMELADCVNARTGAVSAKGIDTRNYGFVDGIAEMKSLFGEILGLPSDNVIVGGNSSLNLMFDYVAQAYATGICGNTPWCRLPEIKFLCPVPGYDRHFAVTEHFGISMICVPMTDDGPDMDLVEELVKDPAVKGMWCVPMYSNPDGITYSDETVRRLARLHPAAKDFRILWDNAYCVHHLTDTPDTLLNLYEESKAAGNEDIAIYFTSTSKISFPGSGVAAVGGSAANIADITKRLSVQTIGYDKQNMLRHARFFKDMDAVTNHMKLHAAILRPKFDIVLTTLQNEIGDLNIADWHTPNGGYFVSVSLMEGCAKAVVNMLKEAGVALTGAGATYPYGNDPKDSNLRIAPTYPPCDELQIAMNLFCVCVQIVSIEKLLQQ
ncbi:MAG: aminotransferase class I/II-fold pyridoxal phosphate-dependent enzyme [Clostridia bacterium]|nr:aminotransferase class I/II-fold pyridoxal phosphate-dependent enzyme [Clostridia bacterium]